METMLRRFYAETLNSELPINLDQRLLTWLERIRTEEICLLVTALQGGELFWFPWEKKSNWFPDENLDYAVNVVDGTQAGTYVLFRALIAIQQYRSLFDSIGS